MHTSRVKGKGEALQGQVQSTPLDTLFADTQRGGGKMQGAATRLGEEMQGIL